MSEDNPFEDYERLFKEEHMAELADLFRRKYKAKGINVNEEKLKRALKPFTRIYVDDEDDIVFIDSEKSLIFN